MSRLVHVRNIMAPMVGAEAAVDTDGLTVTEAITREGWRLSPRTVLVRNGELVKRARWNDLPLAANDDALLIAVPGDGGGGNGGSGRTASGIATAVAAIALMVFAPEAWPAWVKLAGVAAIQIGGNVLSNHFFPLRNNAPFDAGPSASPTYALQAQSNQARLGGAIPEAFGRHKIICDLISQPYVEYVGGSFVRADAFGGFRGIAAPPPTGDQLVYELFAVGAGAYEINEVGVATNAVWKDVGGATGSYPNLEFEVVPPGAAVTLFPDNVVTSTEVQSIELKGLNEAGYDWSGPFVTNASGTDSSQLAVDIALPAGLFKINPSTGAMQAATVSFTFEAQEIDDAGAAVGGYVAIVTQTLNLATRDAVRHTFSATVTAGRYRVRAKRTNAKGDTNTSDTLVWLTMRAFLPSVRTYGDMTVIAVKAKATDHLNGTSAQQFYVIATRKLPRYNTVTHAWSANTATRSIADAVAYLCRSSNNGNIADAAVDLARLYALHTTWEARGDHFDGVIDTRSTFWENLHLALRPGRAMPLIAGGVVTFVRDEPKTVPRCAFSPRNMQPNSFANAYRVYSSEAPDALVVDYFDERTWAPLSVFCAFDDSVTDEEEAPRVSLFGVVEREHAWREGMYLLAADRYRRVTSSFSTELEGRVCFKGDLVRVAHWTASWGASFQVLSLAVVSGHDILTLSDPWSVPVGHEADAKLITLTTPDGYVYGPVTFELVDDGATTRQAQLRLMTTATVPGLYAGDEPHDWGVWSGDGLQLERPRAVIGLGTLSPRDCLIQEMKPQGDGVVSITAVVEDSRVHDADEDDPPDETAPPVVPAAAVLTISDLHLDVVAQANGSNQVNVTVIGANDATFFEAQWKWIDAADYGPIASGLDRAFSFASEAGALLVQVRGVGRAGYGNWFVKATSATQSGVSTFYVVQQAAASLRKVQQLLDQYAQITIAQTYKQEVTLPGLVAGVSASVSRETTLRADAVSALAQLIETVTATANDATATAMIKWVAAAGPAGVVSRIALLARAALGNTFSEAGLYLDAMIIDGHLRSQITLDADFIWLKAAAGRVLLSDGGLTTEMLEEDAVTIHEPAQYAGPTTVPNDAIWHTLVSSTYASIGKAARIVGVVGLVNTDGGSADHSINLRLTRNGALVWPSVSTSIRIMGSVRMFVPIVWSEVPGVGDVTYAIEWMKADSTAIDAFNVVLDVKENKR